VRQVCPEEVLTSAPGGFDSNLNTSVCGDELKLRLGIGVEHAATVKAHARAKAIGTRRKAVAAPGATRLSTVHFTSCSPWLALRLKALVVAGHIRQTGMFDDLRWTTIKEMPIVTIAKRTQPAALILG
jgi:hypothetical protein